jgi:hypothetical protein
VTSSFCGGGSSSDLIQISPGWEMSFGIAPQIRTRYLAYLAFGFLGLGILTSILIAPYNALPGRGTEKLPMHSLGQKPILQIELSRNESDLAHILQRGDTSANLRDAMIGNNLDTFLFIPSYTGLLLCLTLLLSRFTKFTSPALPLAVLRRVPIIALSDWTENWGIARTIHHIKSEGAPTAGDALRISTPSLVKWTLTAIVLMVLGVEALYVRSWKWVPLAAVLIPLGSWIAVILSSYARERWG